MRDEVVLDHGEHQGGRADLEEGGDLRRIGVADDHVQSAVLAGVGVRFVAGVDDRSLQRGLEPDLLFEEVGPLSELKVHLIGALAGQLGAHLAGSREDLPGDEVRSAVANDPSERGVAAHEIVLVCAIGVAFAIGVVLVEHQLLPRWEQLCCGGHRPLDDELPGSVVENGAAWIGDLRGRHLRMGVVDVVAGAVAEDGIDEMGLDLRRQRAERTEASCIGSRGLVNEVPGDHIGAGVGLVALGRKKGVDQQRRCCDWVGIVGTAVDDSVLGFDPEGLGDGHRANPSHSSPLHPIGRMVIRRGQPAAVGSSVMRR